MYSKCDVSVSVLDDDNIVIYNPVYNYKYNSNATCSAVISWDVMEFIPREYHFFNAVSINVTTEPRLYDTHDVVVMRRDIVSNGKCFILH